MFAQKQTQACSDLFLVLLCPAAMGMLLVERLRNAGQTFKILEAGASTA